MLEPKREWRTFESIEEELEKLREWKLISSKATEVKQFYYKGIYTEKTSECKVAGFVDDNEMILYINGELHSIHPDYFFDMQKKDFSKNISSEEKDLNKSNKKATIDKKEKADKKEKFIIVDIETPFSFSPKDGIREVAAIVVEDYKVVDELHLAIINNEDEYKKGYGSGLDNIEENEILREEFKTLISKYKYPIIAHNASFDRNFLNYWKWVDKDQIFYCSMNTIKAIEKLDSYKLVDLLKYYNIKDGQKHTAMEDVLDLLELLKVVRPKKWSKLGNSSNDDNGSNGSKIKRNYEVDKEKREEDKARLELAKENIIENILDSKGIVFTGDTLKSRVELSELVIQYGGLVKSSVSKKTNIVVVGENPGSKLTKAQELGIEILSEDEFLKLIHKN